MTEVQFVADVGSGRTQSSPPRAGESRTRVRTATTTATTAANASHEALTLDWAFGLHRDYKAQIHNLSMAATSSSTGTVAAAATSDRRGTTRSSSSSVTTTTTATMPRMLSTLSRSSAGTSQQQQQQLQQQANAYEHRRVFYPLAHIGVIYDAIQNTQQHLLGHRHTIVATCCSANRRFLVTVDEGDRALWSRRARHNGGAAHAKSNDTHTRNKGGNAYDKHDDDEDDEDVASAAREEAAMNVDARAACRVDEDDGSVLIVWDTTTCLPVKTIRVGRYGGVVCCAMSADALYIATINRRVPQELMLWGWTADRSAANGNDNNNDDEGSSAANNGHNNTHDDDDDDDVVPEMVRRIPAHDEQTCVRFSADDAHVLCSNGLRRVFFWVWRSDAGDGDTVARDGGRRGAVCRIHYYSPPILRKELKTSLGNFTQTTLLPGTTMACSGTVDGDVVLWQLQPRDRVVQLQDKSLLKVVRVHAGAVTCVTAEHGYIVTAGVDGCVRFFDTKLRLVAWFDELRGGPIVSLSFDRTTTTTTTTTGGGDGSSSSAPLPHEQPPSSSQQQHRGMSAAAHFVAPDFMVATAHAMLLDVPAKSFHANDRALLRGKLLVQGQDDAVQCLAAHPCLSRLAIAGLSGNVHVWDYTQRRVLTLSLFRALRVQCMAYSPSGSVLAVGFTSGVLKLLHGDTLEELQTFRSKRSDAVTHVCFSADSRMLATGTAGGCVGVYEYTVTRHTHNSNSNSATPAIAGASPLTGHSDDTPSRSSHNATPYTRYEWVLIGHHQSHKAALCGLQFASATHDGEAVRLMSVGADKRLIEYSLAESHPETGLLVRAAHKITQGAVPTGMLWTSSPRLLDRRSTPRGLCGGVGGTVDAFDGASSSSSSLVHHTNDTSAQNSERPPHDDDNDGDVCERHTATPPLDYLVLATDAFKLCVHLSDWTRQCVKTVLAPTFGGPVTSMAIVPVSSRARALPSPSSSSTTTTTTWAGALRSSSSTYRTASAGHKDGDDNDTRKTTTMSANAGTTTFVNDMASEETATTTRACLVYATREKVLGLMQLPLRGDPCACMGVLAHPGTLTQMTTSHDGAFVFTAGGDDQAVLQWRVDGTRLDATAAAAATTMTTPSSSQQQQPSPSSWQRRPQQARSSSLSYAHKSTNNNNDDNNDNNDDNNDNENDDEDDDSAVPLDHLLTVIEGGAEGPVLRDIVDYFYYAQIRAQGETTTAKRELVGAVSFAQVPHLLRALGVYLSELELGHMAYEVANLYGPPGQPLAAVDMDAILLRFAPFLRLYVNYRPVVGVTARDVRAAFAALGADAVTGELSRDALFAALSSRAEALRGGEVAAALHALLGDGIRVDMLDDAITARDFAAGLLGFDDYDDDDDDKGNNDDDDANKKGDDNDADEKRNNDGDDDGDDDVHTTTTTTMTRMAVTRSSSQQYSSSTHGDMVVTTTAFASGRNDDDDDDNDDDAA